MPCPKCGSNERHQEIYNPCDDCKKSEAERVKDYLGIYYCCDKGVMWAISFLVCDNCGFREYDD